MSALDPTGPSQPEQQTGLNQSQNPASKTAREETTAHDTTKSSSSAPIDHRSAHDIPSQHGETATPSALGAGDTGKLKEKQIPESDAQNYSKGDSNLEGEQMRMAGEGEVARAVCSGGGGGHAEERSLTGDINRQENDHTQALHERGERTGKELEEKGDEDWTGKKADIAQALGQEDQHRPPVVLAAEE